MTNKNKSNSKQRFALRLPTEKLIGGVVDRNFSNSFGPRRAMLIDQLTPNLYSQIYVTSVRARELCPETLLKAVRGLENLEFNLPRTDENFLSLHQKAFVHMTAPLPGDIENADQIIFTHHAPYKEDSLPQRRLPENMMHLRISGNFKTDEVGDEQIHALTSAIHSGQIIKDYVEWHENGRRDEPSYTPTLCGVMGDPIARKLQYNLHDLVFLPGREEWTDTLSNIVRASIATVDELATRHGVTDACHTALSVPRIALQELIVAEQLIAKPGLLTETDKTIAIHLPSGSEGAYSDWLTQCVSDVDYWNAIMSSDYSRHMEELLNYNKST